MTHHPTATRVLAAALLLIGAAVYLSGHPTAARVLAATLLPGAPPTALTLTLALLRQAAPHPRTRPQAHHRNQRP